MRLISWNMTRACNLKCRHCYRDAGFASAGELSTAQGKELVRQAASCGFKIFVFSGGEPLLRPDLAELVGAAKEAGLHPVIGTNGTLLTRQYAQKLKEAGLAAAGISLDSLAPEKHDTLRGVPGAWQDAVAGMEACRQAGLPFQVHTTVFRWNQAEVEKITDFAVQKGAKAHHIFFLIPTGRAAHAREEELDPISYERLLQRLMEKQRHSPIELKPTCAPQFMRLAREAGISVRFSKGCLAGTAYCCVAPQGEVLPCPYLALSAGNIKEHSFTEIWQGSSLMTRLRQERPGGKCGRCIYQAICGGCRARAFAETGDYMAADPGCTYGGSENGTNGT